MPEGPEIKRAADAVAQAIEGRLLVQPELPFPTVNSYQEAWDGAKVLRVGARGKALVIELEGGDCLYSHNQLYGRWYIRKPGSYPKTNRQLRLGLHTEHRSALLYSATDIEVLSKTRLERHPYLRKLGPDILDPRVDRRVLQRRLLERAYRNRKLAALYLDQGFLAGPGNYLRCEILFLARVHPNRTPEQLTSKQRARLAEMTIRTAQRAYESKGITTPPELSDRLKAQGLRRREYRHFVYNRAGRPCHQCRTEVEVKVLGGRKLFFCPLCQPEH